jgi:hypothetical protein
MTNLTREEILNSKGYDKFKCIYPNCKKRAVYFTRFGMDASASYCEKHKPKEKKQ